MKLELKHLAHYLPYELECIIIDGSVEDENGVEMIGLNIDYITLDAHNKYDYNFDEIMPILRPLSDLLKTIEINNETFMPARKLGFYQTDVDLVFNNKTNLIQFRFVQKLIEWHFDIFGLIDKGLAVDINSL